MEVFEAREEAAETMQGGTGIETEIETMIVGILEAGKGEMGVTEGAEESVGEVAHGVPDEVDEVNVIQEVRCMSTAEQVYAYTLKSIDILDRRDNDTRRDNRPRDRADDRRDYRRDDRDRGGNDDDRRPPRREEGRDRDDRRDERKPEAEDSLGPTRGFISIAHF